MIKKLSLVIVFWMIAFVSVFAQGISDGPYVLYKDDQIEVKSVQSGALVSKAYSLADKANVRVPVIFSDHPDWNFSVGLKQELVNEPSEYLAPEKVFFISDIEGEFAGFRGLLLSNGVINEKYEWTFGKGHLVICGDLFDRGETVNEAIWLIYLLEQKAKAAGGYVHTILGNHDIMNLSGDLRYLHPKYLQSAKVLGEEYMSLFNVDTEIGRWLRTKNTIEKIGDNLCLHAGISPEVTKLGLSLSVINSRCRPYYDNAANMRGVNDPLVDVFFTAASSPFWYRGYFFEPKATEMDVEQSLNLFGAKRIIVGHTIVPGNIGSYYGGKVIGIDVNQHQGDHRAVFFEGDKWYVVDDKGMRKSL